MTRILTKERVAEIARDFYATNRRVPRSTELGFGVRKRIYEYWPRWENFIRDALGQDAHRHHWSDEQLLTWLKDFHLRLQRIPTHTEINAENSSVAKLLYEHFPDLNTAFERAIGTSVRAEILKAIKRLTPPPCETASTQEIFDELLVNQVRTSKQIVANTLVTMKQDSLVIGGRYSRSAWWTMTAKGRELLNTIEKERGNGKRRA